MPNVKIQPSETATKIYSKEDCTPQGTDGLCAAIRATSLSMVSVTHVNFTREFFCQLEAISKDRSGSGFLLFSWKLCAEIKFRALLGSQSTDPAKAPDTREGKVNLHLCSLATSTPVKELLRLSQLYA